MAWEQSSRKGRKRGIMYTSLMHKLDNSPGIPLIMRGFTHACRDVCAHLVRLGRRPVAIIDVNPVYSEQTYLDIPILSPERLVEYRDALVIVFIYRIKPILAELAQAGIPASNIVDYFQERWSDMEKINANLPAIPFEENMRLFEREQYKEYCVRSRPYTLGLETSTDCNLNCSMCAFHDENEKRRHNATIRSLYTANSFDFLVPSLAEASLYGGGEPLLKPLFWECAGQIGKMNQNAAIRLTTNGILLNTRNIGRLVENPAVKVIEVSIDGACDQTFWRIRGDGFPLVVDNVRHLTDAKRAAGRDDLSVNMAVTVMRENVEELEDIVRLAVRLGVDGIWVSPIFYRTNEKQWILEKRRDNPEDFFTFHYYQQRLHFYPNLTRAKLEKARKTAAELGIPFREREALIAADAAEDIEYPLPPEEFIRRAETYVSHPIAASEAVGCASCPWPWAKFLVNAFGNATMCCHLPLNILGNVYWQPFEELWNGSIAQNIRKGVIQGRLNTVCFESGCQYAPMDHDDMGKALPLPYEESISFAIGDNNVREFASYRRLGFPEAEGMWFDVRGGEIVYKPQKREEHRLVLNWRPRIDPKSGLSPEVVVSIEGHVVKRWSTRDGSFSVCEIDIPGDACRGEHDCITVAFAFDSTETPELLAQNELRTFQLRNMRITKK